MSGAGDKLRAERARFEKELASPGVIPDPAIGADDARHFLADTPEAPADDSVWDDVGDDDPREEAPARPGPSTRAKVAMPTTPYLAATRDAAAAKSPPSPTLPTPSPDLTVNIRAALDAAEKGLRASVVARTEMERLAASRGAGRRPGGTAAFARPHAASPKTPVIGAAGETFSLAALPRPTERRRSRGLGFENEDDPEAQAYLKGVLRMLYDAERAPEAQAPAGRPRGRRRGAAASAASERERVVSRRAHSRSPGSVASAASPAGAATTPAEDQKTTPETTVSSAKGSNPGGADGGERSDEGTAAGSSPTAASPLRGSFAFAPDGGAAGLEAVEDMKEDKSTAPPLVGSAAPGGSPAVLPPTPGLPPTPSAPNADAAAVPSAFPSAAAAAEHATAEIRASYAAWGGRRDAGPSVTPEMVSELDALEREYVRVGGGRGKRRRRWRGMGRRRG